nr:hypothetical protein [Tanacetum cinerariifolium]
MLFSLTNWCCSISAVSYIEYALTVNPTIYVSCIKQFWNTVAVKQSNDVTRLQALVDKKKVVVTKAAIREALRLDDAEGVDCLPNEEIFTELARMGYEKLSTKLTFYKAFFSSQWKLLIHTILQSMSAKRTSWNEFGLAMASSVICLSTCRKFNFFKYIFDSLVRNVDGSSKFYMYHRSVGKGCSRVETPLFKGMLVAKKPEEQGDAEEQGTNDNAAEEPVTAVSEDDVENQSIPSPTPPTPPPQQPQDIPSTSQTQSPPPQLQYATPAQPQGADFPMSLLQEALDGCAALARRVEHLEHDKVAQDQEIIKLKTRVKKLERANKVKALKLRRLKKVGTSQRVNTSDDTILEDVSNQGRMIDELDRDEGAVLMSEKEAEEVTDITGDAQVEGRQADIYQIDMDHAVKVLSMQEDEPEVQEPVEVVTTAKLITEVIVAVSETVSAAAVVPTITVVVVPTVTAAPVKSKDKGKCIMVEEPKPMKKKQQVELDEAYAKKLHEELNQDIDWEVAMDHVKQKAKENPYVQRYQVMKKRPQTKAQARRSMMVYLKNTAGFSKSDVSEGFNQIIDFLNGSNIVYALTVNPTIYVSYIKQFWNTVAIKQSNDVTRLQALVNKKKVMVIEAAIRDALHLDDAEGVDCLPNEEIFTELARMGYEKPVEKGCSGDETPLFEGMLVAREPEEQEDDVEDQSIPSPTSPTPPPQQPQDIPSTSQAQSPPPQPQSPTPAQAQGADFPMSLLQETLDACAALARRVDHLEHDKRVDTSDDTLMEDVSNQGRMIDELDKDEGVVLMNEKEETKKVRDNTGDAQVEGRQADIYQIDMDHAAKVLSMQEDESKVQEAVEVVTTTKLITEVVAAVSETVNAAVVVLAAVTETVSTAAVVSTVTAAPVKVVVPSTRRKKGVVIWDPDEESSAKTPTETMSQDKGKDIDWEVAIDHVKQKAKENPYVQRYQVMKKRPQTKAQARRNMMMYLKNTAGFRLDYFKGMSYDDIRLIFEAKINSNIEFLLKTKEQIEEEANIAIESINKTPAQKAAKKRRRNEEVKDVEELKRHLEIVPDEDDDVFTEATPLARKVPVVDYQIVHINNKPHFKIIRADETHQLYERFPTSKPNNFSDDFLLTTLRAMFGRPDGQDQVWTSQRSVRGQARVKSWKLLESCGVHIVVLMTTQLIMLVERRYSLSRFTLDQMLNTVRLQVEEQSEMSLELIRFTRQQLQEALEVMLSWSIKKNTKCLLLLVKILVLPGKSDAAAG